MTRAVLTACAALRGRSAKEIIVSDSHLPERSYRRALETACPEAETIGFAGFFGFTPRVLLCATLTLHVSVSR